MSPLDLPTQNYIGKKLTTGRVDTFLISLNQQGCCSLPSYYFRFVIYKTVYSFAPVAPSPFFTIILYIECGTF